MKGATATYTLEAAAVQAVALSKGVDPASLSFREPEKEVDARIDEERKKYAPSQKFIRGLYAGGTLGYEAILIARDALSQIYTNTPVSSGEALEGKTPHDHTLPRPRGRRIYKGKAPSMIEPSLRNQWILDQGKMSPWRSF